MSNSFFRNPFRRREIQIENLGLGPKPPQINGFQIGGHAVGPAITLQQVLSDTSLYESVLAFATRKACEEQLLFVKATEHGYMRNLTWLMRTFFDPTSMLELNISGATKEKVRRAYAQRAGAFANGPVTRATRMGGYKERHLDDALFSAVREAVNSVNADVLPLYIRSREYTAWLEDHGS